MIGSDRICLDPDWIDTKSYTPTKLPQTDEVYHDANCTLLENEGEEFTLEELQTQLDEEGMTDELRALYEIPFVSDESKIYIEEDVVEPTLPCDPPLGRIIPAGVLPYHMGLPRLLLYTLVCSLEVLVYNAFRYLVGYPVWIVYSLVVHPYVHFWKYYISATPRRNCIISRTKESLKPKSRWCFAMLGLLTGKLWLILILLSIMTWEVGANFPNLPSHTEGEKYSAEMRLKWNRAELRRSLKSPTFDPKIRSMFGRGVIRLDASYLDELLDEDTVIPSPTTGAAGNALNVTDSGGDSQSPFAKGEPETETTAPFAPNVLTGNQSKTKLEVWSENGKRMYFLVDSGASHSICADIRYFTEIDYKAARIKFDTAGNRTV